MLFLCRKLYLDVLQTFTYHQDMNFKIIRHFSHYQFLPLDSSNPNHVGSAGVRLMYLAMGWPALSPPFSMLSSYCPELGYHLPCLVSAFLPSCFSGGWIFALGQLRGVYVNRLLNRLIDPYILKFMFQTWKRIPVGNWSFCQNSVHWVIVWTCLMHHSLRMLLLSILVALSLLSSPSCPVYHN